MMQDDHPETIVKSARYPRVAVLLGVKKQFYIPLLTCRSLSTIFALLWAWNATCSIYRLVVQPVSHDDVAGPGQTLSVLSQRLMVSQIVLSFLWAAIAAYLAHLFASSLMSRWLLHYSPSAVLVRLSTVSLILAVGCSELFRQTGALEPQIANLSRCLPIWVLISVGLLLLYFFTQQDISIEHDRDDRRRRLLLRLKCLYTIAGGSLLSLMALVVVMHLGDRAMMEIWRNEVQSRVTQTIDWVESIIRHHFPRGPKVEL